MKTARRFILAVSVLMVPNAVWAHHSYAMFDQTKKLTVQGTVRALEWANPHVWLWVDVSDGAGSTVSYGFESNAPSELARFFGWNKLSVIAGNKITVDYSPLKSDPDLTYAGESIGHWGHTRIYERSDSGWFERYCDNNRDGNDAEPDLTPPK